MNKKIRIILLSLIAFLILTLTTTYGLWYISKKQTNYNAITTKCLDISLTDEQNDIMLLEAYPVTDEEGIKLTPYTFTVTNNCNSDIEYQLNLELLGDSESSVKSSSIKVGLNEEVFMLNSKEISQTMMDKAYVSYELIVGVLESNESINYNLRLWVDQNAPISESNKRFESKISLVAGQIIQLNKKQNPFKKGTLAYSIIESSLEVDEITTLDDVWHELEFESEKAINIVPGASYFWGTGYEFNSKTGFKLNGNIVSASLDECQNNIKLCGNYTLGQNARSANATQFSLTKVNSFNSETGTWFITGQEKKAINDFSEASTSEYAKLHKAKDEMFKIIM